MTRAQKWVLLSNGLLLALIFLGTTYYPMDSQLHLEATLQSFSKAHLLGTDHLGRDLFSLLVQGAGRTIEALVVATGVSFIGGVTLGLTIGYFEKAWCQYVKALVDVCMIVPSLISALIVTAFWGVSPLTAGIAIGLFGIGQYMNQADGLTRREKNKAYIVAARLLGVPWYIILYKRIARHIVAELFVTLGNRASQVVIAYAALTFIGLGNDFTKPDWGSMLYEYRLYMVDQPRLLLLPSLCIFWLSLSIHIFFESQDR